MARVRGSSGSLVLVQKGLDDIAAAAVVAEERGRGTRAGAAETEAVRKA